MHLWVGWQEADTERLRKAALCLQSNNCGAFKVITLWPCTSREAVPGIWGHPWLLGYCRDVLARALISFLLLLRPALGASVSSLKWKGALFGVSQSWTLKAGFLSSLVYRKEIFIYFKPQEQGLCVCCISMCL